MSQFTSHQPDTVTLPSPRLDGSRSIEAALQHRRSVRTYRDEPLSLAHASQLLWAAQGVTHPDGKRAAPSAGALYPIETYLVAARVDAISPGLYRYHPQAHALTPIAAGDLRADLSQAALGQPFLAVVPAILAFTAVYARTTGKYGDRGVQYVHMDAGHISENVCLQAAALGLGTVVVGAFKDADVARVLHLPPEEKPLLLIPTGRPV